MGALIENTLPLWRHSSIGETAKEAALSVAPRAPTLRQLVLDIIEEGPATGEAVFATLQGRGVRCVLYSIKPRCSELARQGLIKDSGKRGLSDSGRCQSIIWTRTTDDERAAYLANQEAAQDWTPTEPRPTAAEIGAAMTEKGGWTRDTLAQWGVPWPPPKGWRARLLQRDDTAQAAESEAA